jgi:uncharacterized protein YndB with AHSA1/START domain
MSTISGQEQVKTGRNASGHRTVYTEITIDATPDQVWQVLTDTKNYPNWAKFMVRIDGKIKHNGQIDAYFKPNPNKDKLNKVHHTISVTNGKEFSWSEVFMFGIKDFHRFIVEPTADGKTKFIQSDLVQGGLSWLLGKSIINFEAKNYPIFNKALKAEVERRFSKS